jgi:uncharacterized membrane protein YczE
MAKEYIKRFFICALGLAVFSVGNVFGVLAGSAGTNAWNTLALGITGSTPISFGTATLLISITIILIDVIFKGKIGFGTLMNALLIATFSDIFLKLLSFIPAAPNQFVGVIYTLFGQTLISFATILYMSPGLGCFCLYDQMILSMSSVLYESMLPSVVWIFMPPMESSPITNPKTLLPSLRKSAFTDCEKTDGMKQSIKLITTNSLVRFIFLFFNLFSQKYNKKCSISLKKCNFASRLLSTLA